MPLQIVQNDITKMQVDAIVNAANSSLLGGGGVDGCIHRAAGPALLRECRKLGGCESGSAKVTGAGKLPCRYVIHAVGPIWRGGGYGEKELLTSCYTTSLELALERKCKSVAFPLISSGIYGYPKDAALQVAVDAIRAFLFSHEEQEMAVYLVIYDRASFKIDEKLFEDIQKYIDQNLGTASIDSAEAARKDLCRIPKEKQIARYMEGAIENKPSAVSISGPLEETPGEPDESFSQMLRRKIDESGLSNVQCYKKANVDGQLFSKILGDALYKPEKHTAIAFAIALLLSLKETKELLMKAGFVLSHSNKFDVIIEYFIVNGGYDVFKINEALFAFDQPLLGGQ